MLTLGDTQYHVGALSDFEASFDPTWGRVKPIIRPIVGNHEYGTSGARGYFDYFNGPGRQSGPAGDARQGVLQLQPRRLAPGRPELELRPARQGGGRQRMCCRDRRRSTGCEPTSRPTASSARSPTCTARASTPGYRGNSPTGQAFWEALYEAGADLVLSGDAHDYERFAPQDPRGNFDPARGIRQFVVGTGGVFFTGWSSAEAEQRGAPERHLRGPVPDPAPRRATSGASSRRPARRFTESGSGVCHGRPPELHRAAAADAEGARARALHDSRHRRGRPSRRDPEAGRDLRARRRRRDPRPGRQRRDPRRLRQRPHPWRQGAGPPLRRRRATTACTGRAAGIVWWAARAGTGCTATRATTRSRPVTRGSSTASSGGKGRDRAKVDRADRVRSVERVFRR